MAPPFSGGNAPSRGVAGIPLLVPQGGPPQDGPPNLGSIAGHSLPTFTDFSDFLGRLFLVIVGVVFTVDYLFTSMFFFQMMSSGGIASSIV